jgi:hypothetical protein
MREVTWLVAVAVLGTACSPGNTTGAGGGTSATSTNSATTGVTSTTSATTSATTGTGCPTNKQCAGSCCNASSTCHDDGTGNMMCEQLCTLSSQCPPAKQCCSVVNNLTGEGVCLAIGAFNGQQCRCGATTDCQGGCCAPIADAAGNPKGPYVCKNADGGEYDCETASQTCSNGYCPVSMPIAGNNSVICAKPCTSNTCGAGTCTVLMGGLCSGVGGACLPPAGA